MLIPDPISTTAPAMGTAGLVLSDTMRVPVSQSAAPPSPTESSTSATISYPVLSPASG